MVNVKLSDKPCVFCGAKENTALAKSKGQDFQAVVCGKHLFEILRKWEHSDSQGQPSPGPKV
jgi:hypothetical protein